MGRQPSETLGDVRFYLFIRYVSCFARIQSLPWSLSHISIVRSSRVTLPSPEGEVACLIDATLDVYGTKVDVIVTHFGNSEHTVDRFVALCRR
jgi:hypothetical protein